jgi:hypothetical protein
MAQCNVDCGAVGGAERECVLASGMDDKCFYITRCKMGAVAGARVADHLLSLLPGKWKKVELYNMYNSTIFKK